MEFLFVRHGETAWNAERRAQGQLDTALSARGRAQALAVADALAHAPLHRVVSSPLARAWWTAEPIAARHGLAVERDPDLAECSFGVREGRLRHADGDDPATGDPQWLIEYWAGARAPEGAEPPNAFYDRAAGAILRIAEQAAARGAATLIVAHGGVWRAFRARVAVTGFDAWMPNATPIRVRRVEDGAWRVFGLDGGPVTAAGAAAAV